MISNIYNRYIDHVRQWVRRYLPAEVVGAFTAVLASYLGYKLTNNYILAAYCATIGENIGYYGSILTRDLLLAYKGRKNNYSLKDTYRVIRNMFIEFGFAELLDSLVIRPSCMYFFPKLINNLILGTFLGKIVADLIFYVPTIFFYELKKKYKLDDD